MNTLYKKNEDGTFSEVLIDSTDAVSIIAKNLINEALAKTRKMVSECVDSIVNDSMKTKIMCEIDNKDIGNLVDDAISRAVDDYDYDNAIDNAVDNIDIVEMITEKVTEYLDSSSIQVRIG